MTFPSLVPLRLLESPLRTVQICFVLVCAALMFTGCPSSTPADTGAAGASKQGAEGAKQLPAPKKLPAPTAVQGGNNAPAGDTGNTDP